MEIILPVILPIHLRFTHESDNDLKSLAIWLESMSPARCLTVLEPADNEVPRDHTHTVIYINMDKKRFSERFKKRFPQAKGNKVFAVFDSIESPADLERYICKGRDNQYSSVNPTIVYQSNFPQEHICTRHAQYWEINKKLKELSPPKKITIPQWTERTLEELRTQFPLFDKITEEVIVDLTIRVMDKLGLTARKFSHKILEEMVLGFANSLQMRSTSEAGQRFRKDWTRSIGQSIYHSSALLGRLD